MRSDELSFSPGSRLGPYEITAAIGAGGMGEVYRAIDTKLKREVAIKVLPAEFTQDKERLERFERQAQLLAQLNHTNIAHVYGFESATLDDASSVHFLAMELVEGEDLSGRLKRGAIPLDEAIPIAKQIAEALEEAHEHGIVHRDLKPANVKVTPDGKVKVLDFGLAKAYAAESGVSGSAEVSHSPTLSRHLTEAGLILGTAAYMSPEQARGKAVDKRADIWAFGIVLYEMLCGGSLFAGATVTDTLAGVLKTEIDFSKLPAATPPAIRRLLRRCLERTPTNRLHDIADARIVLDEVVSGRNEEVSEARGVPVPRRATWWFVATALVAGLALGALLARALMSPGPDAANAPPHIEFEIASPADHPFVSGLALSADGRRLAFVARGEDGRTALWVRSVDAPGAQMVSGTTDARYPFWSPDGRQLGFFAQNRLKVTDLLGGSPRPLADTGPTADARGGSWGADDRIVYAPTFLGTLQSISAAGGEPEPATRFPEGSELGTQRFPCFLPDGRRFLFYASTGSGVEPGILYLGRLGSLDAKRLGPADSAAVYAPPGTLLYVKGNSLVAHRFDDGREELVGNPVPLGITLPGSINVSGQRSLAVANQGTLAYRADKRGATRLVWVNRRGEEIGAVSSEPEILYNAPRLSPDDRLLAVSQYEPGSTSGDIWIHDLGRGTAYPLTVGEESDNSRAIWSPDGAELAFAALGGGRASGIYRIPAQQSGPGQLWIPGERYKIPEAWLPGGAGLLYQENDEAGGHSLWTVDLEGRGEPRRLSPARTGETSADLSPDGRWIAFGSDATRRVEVYVRRLDDATGAGTIRISTAGGNYPRWRGDGREIFYVDDSDRLVAVPIELGDKPKVGTPEALFQARLEDTGDPQYDVTSDGQRFLLNRTLSDDRIPIAVVLGWQQRLRQSSPR